MEDGTSPHGDNSTSIRTAPDSPKSPSRPTTSTRISTPAHAVVRLIQCSRCSLPFRTPLRLPCGNTLCRACLPPIRPRTGVSYPANENRKQGFTCLWGREECGGDHCLGDCGTDVLLTRLVDVFDEVLADDSRTVLGSVNGDDPGYRINWQVAGADEGEIHVKSANVGLDLLKGVYDLAKRGQLDYAALGVHYEPPESGNSATLAKLKETVRNDLDCQVCYSLILDPLTTSCGHTFCRSCVAMAMSHSDLCPICRRKLNMSSVVHSERVNKRIAGLIEAFLPEEAAARRKESAPDVDTDGENKIPLFVTSVAFPTMPIFLHIFEPRYRLMMQRVMQSHSRKFGMVMPNRSGRFQAGLGRSTFKQYGTVLVVDRYELLPDGRSLVIATGVSRFKVANSELVDGYHVGRIQRVDDVSISEEEALESMETSTAADLSSSTRVNLAERPLESLSTQQLFQLGVDFVLRQRRQGAGWLHPRVLLAYGALPTDPAQFPWWFATILPVWEEDKYALLSTTTVRQRLKITAGWIRKLESRDCSFFSRSGVVTSFTPFSMSVSISFGGPSGATSHDSRHDSQSEDDSGSYVPQTLVIGLFLAIFATQMAANVVQTVRTRRQSRGEGARPTQVEQERPRIPTETEDEPGGFSPAAARDADTGRDG